MTPHIESPPLSRRWPRVHLRGTAQVAIAGTRVAGELLCVSQGGAFVGDLPSLVIGTEVQLHLLLPPDMVPMKTVARVLYNLPPANSLNGRPAGTGFEFVLAGGDVLSRVSRVVSRIEALKLELLAALDDEPLDRALIDAICRETGLPRALSVDELRWRLFTGHGSRA